MKKQEEEVILKQQQMISLLQAIIEKDNEIIALYKARCEKLELLLP